MSSFVIEDAYKITGIGIVIVGKVIYGSLRIGMKARLNNQVIEIMSIEKHHSQLSEAKTGENVVKSAKPFRWVRYRVAMSG